MKLATLEKLKADMSLPVSRWVIASSIALKCSQFTHWSLFQTWLLENSTIPNTLLVTLQQTVKKLKQMYAYLFVSLLVDVICLLFVGQNG